ncbi:MAG: DUF998 domain-containing protein [Candidatus Saccharimonadales bacterium]
MLKDKIKPITFGLAIFAAILYNIWPLGYALDPSVLHNSYVSSLEVSGKPYAWLFILADILTGIIAIIIGFNVRKIEPHNRVSFMSYILFGLATGIDAIIPIASRCEVSISACGISPSQILSPHDIASIVAAFSIFAILLNAKHQFYKNNENIYKWITFAYWAWCATGIFLIISVITDDFTIISQALFLAMCGVGLVVTPTNLIKAK